MDWELKMPHPWEFTEMEQNADPSGGIGPSPMLAQGGPGFAIQPTGGSGRLDCSVDLKLGGLGDFGGPAEKWNEQQQHHHHHRSSTVSSSPSGSSKRARAPSHSSQNVSCLVDGCKSDLSGCKEYNRRHKVCAAHSKTAIVLVGGQEQRFCQQCSRFHLLVEFDEVKRSCRKRLDGHNRRRRKPQPDSINSGSLFTTHQDSRYSSYPQIFPTAASDSPWPIIVKTEEEPLYPYHPPAHFLDRQHQHFSSSFPRSFKEGKNFPFLQDSDRATTLESPICQPILKSISSAESSSSSSSKIFCALSLLSSPPQTSSIDLGQIVPSADRIPMGQPLLSYGGSGGLGLGRHSGSHQASNHVSTTGFSCSGMEDEHVGSTVLVPDGSDPEMNCQGLFGVGGEGSSDGGTQALPFAWN